MRHAIKLAIAALIIHYRKPPPGPVVFYTGRARGYLS